MKIRNLLYCIFFRPWLGVPFGIGYSDVHSLLLVVTIEDQCAGNTEQGIQDSVENITECY